MIVRELLEFLSETRTVKLQPNGRRIYYLGSAKDIPESLMECEVTELAPGLDDDDNPIMGIWVNRDKDWDLMVDCFGTADDVVSSAFDGAYYQLIEDRETQEQEAQKIIQTNRENRRNRWFSHAGLREPKYMDIQELVFEIARAKDKGADREKTRDLSDLIPIPDELLRVDDGEEFELERRDR